MRLREEYIVAGEVSANDWHDVFLNRTKSSAHPLTTRGSSGLSGFQRLFSRRERSSEARLPPPALHSFSEHFPCSPAHVSACRSNCKHAAPWWAVGPS